MQTLLSQFDQPEETDSLVLEFYAKDLDQWDRIWSAKGEAVTSFKRGHILIKNSDYKNLISEFFKTDDNGDFTVVLEENYNKIYLN